MIYFRIIHAISKNETNKCTSGLEKSIMAIEKFFGEEHELYTRTFELSFENCELPNMNLIKTLQEKVNAYLGINYNVKIIIFRNISNTGLRIFMAAENKTDGHIFNEDDINALIDYIAKLLDMSGMTGELCVEDSYIPYDVNIAVLN